MAKMARGLTKGICTFDDELRVTAWNGRFLQLLGLPGELIRVGLPLTELVAYNQARGEYGVAAMIADRGDSSGRAGNWTAGAYPLGRDRASSHPPPT